MSKKELEKMTFEELEEKLEKLKDKVRYEEEKLKVCAYGKDDIMHIEEIYAEIHEIKNKLYESVE